MNNQPDNSLERWIDRELRALPDMEAPPEFAHGVMRAVIMRQRMPWYRTLWQSGSHALRAGILALLLAVVAGALLLVFHAEHSPVTASISAHCSTAFVSLQAMFGALVTLVLTLMDALMRIHPMIPSALTALMLIVVSLYVICLGAGTTLAPLVLSRIHHFHNNENV